MQLYSNKDSLIIIVVVQIRDDGNDGVLDNWCLMIYYMFKFSYIFNYKLAIIYSKWYHMMIMQSYII